MSKSAAATYQAILWWGIDTLIISSVILDEKVAQCTWEQNRVLPSCYDACVNRHRIPSRVVMLSVKKKTKDGVCPVRRFKEFEFLTKDSTRMGDCSCMRIKFANLKQNQSQHVVAMGFDGVIGWLTPSRRKVMSRKKNSATSPTEDRKEATSIMNCKGRIYV